MHKKCIAIAIIAVVIAGGGAFYGGMQYNKSKSASQMATRNGGGQFQGQQGQGGNKQSGGQRMGGGNGNQGDFSGGEIISKDDKSITIKTKDGGSKIIYFSDSTKIGKAVEGSSSDLSVGQQIMITGKADANGSVTAQNIQIRPADQGQPAQ